MATQTGKTLSAQGYRFIYRDGRYLWAHALEMQAGDVDCSDMDDAEFEQFVREHEQKAEG